MTPKRLRIQRTMSSEVPNSSTMATHSPCHDSCWRYWLSHIGSAALRRLFDLESEVVRIEVGTEARDLAVGHLQDAHALI